MNVQIVRFLKWRLVSLVMIVTCLLATTFANAADRFCTRSGKWNSTDTWSAASNGTAGASIPVAGDRVFIESGRTVTVDSSYSAACADLFVGTSVEGTGTLTFSANSSLFLTGKLSVGGNGGTSSDFATGTINFALNAVLTVMDSITIGTDDINHNGSLNFTHGGLLRIGSLLDVKFLGKFTAGAGTIEYNGADQIVSPRNVLGTYNNLTLSGSGLKTTANVAVNGTLSMEGTAAASATMNLDPSATLRYGGSSPQIIGPEFGILSGTIRTFNGTGGVIVDNPAGVTLGSDCGILNGLMLISGNFNIGSHVLTLYGPPIGGTPANLKSGSSSSLKFISNLPGLFIPASVTELKELTLISSLGLTLRNDLSAGSVTLLGKITTGRYCLSCDAIEGAPGPANYIFGKVRHHFTRDGFLFSFPVGDASYYTPVEVSFGPEVNEGDLIVSVTAALHPEHAAAGFKAGKIIPFYYTIAGSGLVFNKCTATFTFAAAKVPGDAKADRFVVRKYGAGWTALQTGERSAVSIRANGITSFGDFVIGEGQPDAGTSLLTYAKDTLIANGKSMVVLVVAAMDVNGNPISAGGEAVSIKKIRGSGIISAVTDQGTGRYRAVVTSPSTAGSGVFEATINGEPVKNGKTKQFQTEIFYMAGLPAGKKSTLTLGGAPTTRNGNFTLAV
ncbi:MAG: Ig-like domain-containing protein, partial [bacterium]